MNFVKEIVFERQFVRTSCNQSVADEQYVGAAIVLRVLKRQGKRQEARGKRQGEAGRITRAREAHSSAFVLFASPSP